MDGCPSVSSVEKRNRSRRGTGRRRLLRERTLALALDLMVQDLSNSLLYAATSLRLTKAFHLPALG